MQTIIIRIILNEDSHDIQLSAPTVFAALREHKEFFVLFQRETLTQVTLDYFNSIHYIKK